MAGSWYPGEAQALAANLDELLAKATILPRKAPVVALVSPHAGYRFSGKAAASGYALLRGQEVRRVILLAPSHHTHLRGVSIPDVTHFETPLGLIPLDGEVVARLRATGWVKADAAAEIDEHALEMQLPFLQRILPRFLLVPLLVGDLEEVDYVRFAKALLPWMDRTTILIASSDFTHRGSNYRYEVPAGEGGIQDRLARVDDGSVKQMLAIDRSGLLQHAKTTGSTICGLTPVALLLETLHRCKKVQGHVASRYTSGDVTSDGSNTVTYIDMVFSGDCHGPGASVEGGGGEVFPLSREEKRLLVRLARASLTAAVKKGRFDDQVLRLFEKKPSLERKAGAFVTLKCRTDEKGQCIGRGRDLRGCMGTLEPVDSMLVTVARRAATSGLEDSRFPKPVSEEELPLVSIEISVLTPPRPATLEEIIIGKHGIVLTSGSHHATFLPQVASEQGWDRETTLRHLALKAGLKEDAWKSASYAVYEAIVFGEEEGS